MSIFCTMFRIGVFARYTLITIFGLNLIALTQVSFAVELVIKDKKFINTYTAIGGNTDNIVTAHLNENIFEDGHDTIFIEGKLALISGEDLSGEYCSGKAAYTIAKIKLDEGTPHKDTYPADDFIRRRTIEVRYDPNLGEVSVRLHGYPGYINADLDLTFPQYAFTQNIKSLDVADAALRCVHTSTSPVRRSLVDFQIYMNDSNTIVSLKPHAAAAGQAYFTMFSYGYGEATHWSFNRTGNSPVSPKPVIIEVAHKTSPSPTQHIRVGQPQWSLYTTKWHDVLNAVNRDWGAKAYPTRSPTLNQPAKAAAVISPAASIILNHM